MVYELKFLHNNGAEFTCIAYATNTHTAEKSLMDCIFHQLKDGAQLLSVTRDESETVDPDDVDIEDIVPDTIDPDDVDPATIDPNTFECRFVGWSGSVITIDRYGQNDYSAVWDDTYSVRGTFTQIIDELKGEI